MRLAVVALALLCGIAGSCRSFAQEPLPASPLPDERKTVTAIAGPKLVFLYVPRTPDVSPWQIEINGDRGGTFRQLPASGDGEPSSAAQPTFPVQQMHVSEAIWKKLAAAEPAVRSGHCETKQKGLAQTGVKTISLAAGSAVTSCTFNYSDDNALNGAADEFVALAEMVQHGAKLQHDRRFDRLSLDADMDALLADIAGGRAVEPGNIAPVLQAVADDDRVIDRARRKAARLLQSAGPLATVPAAPEADASRPQ